MTEFWIVAAMMSVIALAFVAWPIWRHHELHGQWSFAGMLSAALLVPAAVWIYLHVTTWNGQEPTSQARAHPEQLAIVEQLAHKLQENPDDVEGWMLLGRSYLALEDFPAARSAFLQAWQRTPQPGTDLKLGLGMAMIHSDRASLGSDGGQLIEEVLEAEPNNEQALWYGGLVALERGRQDMARDRWSKLLAMNPPREVADVLEQQIAMLGEVPDGVGFGRSETPANSPSATSAPGTAASSAASVTLHVALGDDVSTNALGPNAALFIFARSPGGGPPLAVIRRPVNALPGEFTLTDADTMIQGNSLSNFAEITLVARVSASGQPIEQSGDLYAEAKYSRDRDKDGVVELLINKVVP